MAKTIIVYQTNRHGEYIGTAVAQESPRQPGLYLMPPNTYKDEPPPQKKGFAVVRKGESWEYVKDYRDAKLWFENGLQAFFDFFQGGWNGLDKLPEGVIDKEPDLSAENRVLAECRVKLRDTDWTQLDDTPTEIKKAYLHYRQALRNVHKQANFPHDVDWPKLPDVVLWPDTGCIGCDEPS